jgi:hypothetical protein
MQHASTGQATAAVDVHSLRHLCATRPASAGWPPRLSAIYEKALTVKWMGWGLWMRALRVPDGTASFRRRDDGRRACRRLGAGARLVEAAVRHAPAHPYSARTLSGQGPPHAPAGHRRGAHRSRTRNSVGRPRGSVPRPPTLPRHRNRTGRGGSGIRDREPEGGRSGQTGQPARRCDDPQAHRLARRRVRRRHLAPLFVYDRWRQDHSACASELCSCAILQPSAVLTQTMVASMSRSIALPLWSVQV